MYFAKRWRGQYRHEGDAYIRLFGWLAAIYMFTFSILGSASALQSAYFRCAGGCMMALLLAVLSTLISDQIIGGTVINILAVGLTGFLTVIILGSGSGFGGSAPNSPGVLPTIHVPIREIFTTDLWCRARLTK